MTSKERDRRNEPKAAEPKDTANADLRDLPQEGVSRPEDVKGGSTVLEERWKR